MLNKNNIEKVLIEDLKFNKNSDSRVYSKYFPLSDCILKIDIDNSKILYPTDKGMKVHDKTTSNFFHDENFVVFICVYLLLDKGYQPNHLELEPRWKLGGEHKGGKADILVKDNYGKSLLIIECKTAGEAFNTEWEKTKDNGGQLFSYLQQDTDTQYLCLFCSDYIDNTLKSSYYLIAVKDDKDLISNNKNALSFEASSIVEDKVKAWKETYGGEASTSGVFEVNVPAYHIGHTKRKVDELQKILSYDRTSKYHQFATVLRKYNVSGHENAFDKLVNLFLAKIVDEKENSDDLKFYWYGNRYDSEFNLINRLEKLYKTGMEKFLKEDVTYIEDEEINKAFSLFEHDPDFTRDKILEYFRQIKFYTNNDFAFIDVHNEKLFYKNSRVLIDVVKIFQDCRLETEEQNQFLGDMFEGFLDQGIKQSEGQFFTPIPIVKFIVSSLPLKKLINKNNIPKMIDYACGAGHFLTEYASQIKDIIAQQMNISTSVEERKKLLNILSEYYKNTIGIEKEYRLSKVSKVSTFMYGQDDIQIIFDDALRKTKDKMLTNDILKDGTFNILVANPPYSVKGFLETLDDENRSHYELYDCIDKKSIIKNNEIQLFFIERAKQLMKIGGVAGIIVPASVLNNPNNSVIATRKILLENYNIISIASFGNKTFGKTGTNTVILFLCRRENVKEHFQNRINDVFSQNDNIDRIYEDTIWIRKYCDHININIIDYITLFDIPNADLLKTELMQEYKNSFILNAKGGLSQNIKAIINRNSEIREKASENINSSSKKETSALIKKILVMLKEKACNDYETSQKTDFKSLNDEIFSAFVEFVCECEKEKILYYILSSLNNQKVLLINVPESDEKQKKFLGYEWSSTKGKEGIKYNSAKIESDGDSELTEDELRSVANVSALNNIETPLYDPSNYNNEEKINVLIRNAFNGSIKDIPETLKEYVGYSDLNELIDFNHSTLNLVINTLPPKTKIQSKVEEKRLENILVPVKGFTTKISNKEIKNSGKYPVVTQESKVIISGYCDNNKPITDLPLIVFGDHNCTFKYVDFEFIRGADGTQLLKTGEGVNVKYLYYFLSTIKLKNGKYERHFKYLKNINIPIPRTDIQNRIIAECNDISEEVIRCKNNIMELENVIKNKINEILSYGYSRKSIADISYSVEYGTSEKSATSGKVPVIGMGNIQNGKIVWEDLVYTNDEELITKYSLKDGDVLFNRTNSPEHVGKVGIYKGEQPAIYAGYLIRINYKKELVNPSFLTYILNSDEIRQHGFSVMSKSINQANISGTKLKAYEIPLPDKEEVQDKFAAEMVEIEEQILKMQAVINNEIDMWKEVIQKYLY